MQTENTIHGFRFLKYEGLFAAFEALATEGTCWAAYDTVTDQLTALMLENDGESRAIRATNDADNADWQTLDQEIIEALLMLPAMRNLCTESLYWCCSCKKISITPFDCGCNTKYDWNLNFGVNFGEDGRQCYN